MPEKKLVIQDGTERSDKATRNPETVSNNQYCQSSLTELLL